VTSTNTRTRRTVPITERRKHRGRYVPRMLWCWHEGMRRPGIDSANETVNAVMTIQRPWSRR
jgi:hypothetical protein